MKRIRKKSAQSNRIARGKIQMSQIGTGKAPNRFLTMLGRFADWLGSARRENDDISSDAVRIASLKAANDTLKAETRAANIKAIIWQTKAEDLQDKLTVAEAEIEDCRSLVAYARKRKASLAKHDAKRRGK